MTNILTRLFARILPVLLLGPQFPMSKVIDIKNISTADGAVINMPFAQNVQEVVMKEACSSDVQLYPGGVVVEDCDSHLEVTTRESTGPANSSDAGEELDLELPPASRKRPDLLTTAELGIGGLFFMAMTLMYITITHCCSKGNRSPAASATTCIKENYPHTKQLMQRLLTLQSLAQKQAQLQLQLSEELKQLVEELSSS